MDRWVGVIAVLRICYSNQKGGGKSEREDRKEIEKKTNVLHRNERSAPFIRERMTPDMKTKL